MSAAVVYSFSEPEPSPEVPSVRVITLGPARDPESYGNPYGEPESYGNPYGEPESYGKPYGEPGPYDNISGEPESYGEFLGLTPEGEPQAMTISDPHVTKIMSTVSGLMAIAIILENIIVLCVLCRQWPKQNPNITYFIIHLAIADLLSGFQFLWFNCIDVHLQLTHNGYWILGLCGLWMVSIAASTGGILNFASLRIHALKNAMKNERYSRRRAIITIACSWLVPLAILFLPAMLGWNCVSATQEQINQGKECSQAVFPFKKAYVLLLVCLLLFATVWLLIVYIRIYGFVHARLRSVRSDCTKAKGKETERHLFITMVIILALFCVCHLPLCGVFIADYVVTERSTAVIDAFQIILVISFVNALLNPVVYYWRMPATRDAFWLAFGAKRRTQIGHQISVTASRLRDKAESTVSSINEFTSQRPDFQCPSPNKNIA